MIDHFIKRCNGLGSIHLQNSRSPYIKNTFYTLPFFQLTNSPTSLQKSCRNI